MARNKFNKDVYLGMLDQKLGPTTFGNKQTDKADMDSITQSLRQTLPKRGKLPPVPRLR